MLGGHEHLVGDQTNLVMLNTPDANLAKENLGVILPVPIGHGMEAGGIGYTESHCHSLLGSPDPLTARNESITVPAPESKELELKPIPAMTHGVSNGNEGLESYLPRGRRLVDLIDLA